MSGGAPGASTLDVYEVGGASLTATGALREQLMDIIYNVDPFDNPVVAMLPRAKANGVFDQWLKDSLPAISAINTGEIEGAEFGELALTSPSRLTNVTMITRADIKVSGTAQAVEQAGIRDIYGYHVGKFTKTIGNKMETILLDPAVTFNLGDAATARVTKNFNTFLDAAATRFSLPAATNVTAISEDDFNDSLQALWVNGGKTKVAIVDAGTIRQIQASFLGLSKTVTTTADSGANRRTVMADEATLYAAVEFYKSPFGMVTIVLDRWLPNASNATSRIYFLDREYAALAWLRPLKHKLLAETGDSTRGLIVGEWGLRVFNEKAHFIVKGTA